MPYLPHAVESILQQTFEDFELILVDDASSDGSSLYLQSLSDPRLVMIQNPGNLGITGALNAGLEKVRGEFIARLDQDDIALPSRLARQVALLERNASLGLIGSSCISIDGDGVVGKEVLMGKNDAELRWRMLFKNPFVHSTVMMRTSILRDNGLKYESLFGEDFLLWLKILKYTKGHIINEPLIYYRMHSNNVTSSKKEFQDKALKEYLGQAMEDIMGHRPDLDWMEFTLWARGIKQVVGPTEMIYAKFYLSLLKHFAMRYSTGLDKGFFKNSLMTLRSRLKWSTYYSFKLYRFRKSIAPYFHPTTIAG